MSIFPGILLRQPRIRFRSTRLSGSLALFAVVAAGAATGCATTGAAGAVAFARIPNVTVEYYDVTGATAEQIRSAINAQRPIDPNDNRPVDAISRWTVNWKIPVRSDGSCDLGRAEVSFKARVLLPRLVNRHMLPASLIARWDAFAESLAKHEDWHVRYAYEHLPDVQAAIRASSCAKAEAAATAAVMAIAKVERDYDIKARHGESDVLPFP